MFIMFYTWAFCLILFYSAEKQQEGTVIIALVALGTTVIVALLAIAATVWYCTHSPKTPLVEEVK